MRSPLIVIVLWLWALWSTTAAGVNIKRIDQFDGTKFALEDGSWLAIRFSGTEPLLRIYSEAKNEDLVDKLISEARNFVGV